MTCFPKRIMDEYGGARSFRSRKRQQLDIAMMAFKEFTIGSAFVPGYNEHREAIQEHLDSWRHKIRQDEWGR